MKDSKSKSQSALQRLKLPVRDMPEYSSERRFPNGDLFRIEIPSTEGPRALRAVIDEAKQRKVTIHRVSQGSGASY